MNGWGIAWLVAGSVALIGCDLGFDDAAYTFAAEITDEGDLVLEYVEPQSSDYKEIYQILTESSFYPDLLDDLNQTFALLTDVLVAFDECGEENAYYDAEMATITMCYELIKYYADSAHAEYQEDYTQEVIYAGFFTFFHELGHALVDQYQLPIVGGEEDAVDAFAAVLMLQAEEQDAVLAGMEQFDLDAIYEAEQAELPLWGEHSLSAQRMYNLSCLIYGSDPQSYADFIDLEWLPEDRAEGCEAEYEQARNGWNTLLEPYLN
jgi:hypothetical protein